jgi:orotidine-5'-phosphate decarboxylase
MERHFKRLLEARWAADHFVCVGLDSNLERIPESVYAGGKMCIMHAILAFNCAIIEATHDLVCAYKPNIASYAEHGAEGIEALQQTITYIQAVAPGIPVILDGKRGDIGKSNVRYTIEAFVYLNADAITVSPYLGEESLRPFLDRKTKGVIVVCHTSNTGAFEFQDLTVSGETVPGNSMALYEYIAHRVATVWNKNDNCGLVMGATYPDQLSTVRKLVGNMPILIPAIGAQGGDLQQTVKAAGGNHMIINSSDGIIFASQEADFADAARAETMRLRDLINHYRGATAAKEITQ